MGVSNTVRAVPSDPFERVANQLKDMQDEIKQLKSIVRRDCMRVRGYELQYRDDLIPNGVYLVNRVDGDPNFGATTLVGI